MKIIDRLMRSVRSQTGPDTVQGFYGAIARTNPDGGPRYSESKRDYERVRLDADRYKFF